MHRIALVTGGTRGIGAAICLALRKSRCTVAANYAAAKSGIHGFTKALAQEGAKFGVTVNAIAPAYVDTDMVAAAPAPVLEKIVARIPVGRLGEAKEIARGVAFLASENGAFITGSTLSINGGQRIC